MTEEQLREHVETMLKLKQFNVVYVNIQTEGFVEPTLVACVLMNGGNYSAHIPIRPEVLDDPQEVAGVIVGAFTRRAVRLVSEGERK